jgi:hypothetical protein
MLRVAAGEISKYAVPLDKKAMRLGRASRTAGTKEEEEEEEEEFNTDACR